MTGTSKDQGVHGLGALQQTPAEHSHGDSVYHDGKCDPSRSELISRRRRHQVGTFTTGTRSGSVAAATVMNRRP
ncbi:hypothetical protein M8J75_015262 [Diaphorina citri]|nr:hypothetical protein M8J75_015262 [Diaphorina citri]